MVKREAGDYRAAEALCRKGLAIREGADEESLDVAHAQYELGRALEVTRRLKEAIVAYQSSLRIADAMAPCVLFVDEIEKGLAGVSGPAMDSGVSSRLFGHLLSWLNDHTSDVFFVGTCNNMQALPPEFSRAERFDGIFFLDLPEQHDQFKIWNQYQTLYGLEAQGLPDSSGWTGAEIKACCRLAALLNISLVEASLNVVPVSRTAADKIAALRSWADGKCLDANQAGIYQRRDVASNSPRRHLDRPSVN